MRTFDNIPPLLQPGETRAQWEARRSSLIRTIAETEYGCRPEMDYTVSASLRSRDRYPDEHSIRRIVDITVTTALGSHSFRLYLFLPVREEKVPATLLICSQRRKPAPMKLPEGFSLSDLPALFAKMGIIMDGPMDTGGPSVPLDMAVDMHDGHWPVPQLLARGHAAAGFYATDAEPDAPDFLHGLAAVFGTKKDARAETEWGILAVWAFAARCALDYLQTVPELDAARIGITGHSRCGKAALFAGVTDSRFAWVMPNNSGCCGAALLRGKHGENMASINALMPYWFAPGFKKYVGREDQLPFDQHALLALVAPRLLHVASGSLDFWADPAGEHRSTVLAAEVYRLYGNEPLPPEFPAENTAVVSGAIGYHLRKGPHLLTAFDWMQLLDHIDLV